MTLKRTKQGLLNIIQANAGDWLEKIPVITGNRAGSVDAGGGRIWVRFNNGHEQMVLNTLAPLGFDRHILIGRVKTQPAIWRVAEIRESYIESSSQILNFHHEQHEEGGADRLNLNRKQILTQTVRVSNSAGFVVAVYGGQPRTAAGMAVIANQYVNLSSYVPATGARYVNIESNTAGVLSIRAGVIYDTQGLLELNSPASIPMPANGYYRIASILLFDVMGVLLDDYIQVPLPLEINPGDFVAVTSEASNFTAGDKIKLDALEARALKTQAIKIYMNTTMI